jgi:Flp pilus assembly pilin Flp
MRIKNKRGQSTVEYVLLVTAVLAVIIALTSGNQSSSLRGVLNTTLNNAAGDMSDIGGRLSDSHAPAPAPKSTTAGSPPYSVNVAP